MKIVDFSEAIPCGSSAGVTKNWQKPGQKAGRANATNRHYNAAEMTNGGNIEELKERLDFFLLGLRNPVLLEPGKALLDLTTSSYSFSTEYGKLLWHVWNEHSNLVRQITAVQKESRGRMELRFQKFGKGPPGTLILAESRAEEGRLERRSQRTRYSQQLRQSLGQLFPEWRIQELSSEPGLERSFSGRYSRAVLSQGQRAWAVIGSGEQEDFTAADEILSYGLIWLDWLRQRKGNQVIAGLKIFLPAGRATNTLQRLAWMDSEKAQWEIYETGEELRRCDPRDAGNLRTLLPFRPIAQSSTAAQCWAGRLQALSPAIGTHQGSDGVRAWTIRGLPFAKETAKGMVFGVGRSETVLGEETFGELEKLVSQLLRYRRADSADRQHPYFRLQPERWLQGILASEIARLDCGLFPAAVFQQIPVAGGTEHGVIDLLAMNRQGRLAVLELKASEDIHLPLQALDYWMCVHWQQQRGQLEQNGYFRGRILSTEPPLLLLVSPALQFHSSCETILRYFSPAIEAVRIGINENWREQLQVIF
ncbi:MAG: hypothetical protein HY648_12965 [Acidobacteria bacterium]|nr:hypothetical protein [Acidobacteriota bacterium]